ncbi:hypothetical protein RJ640_028668 [Escallonia rubra]|uniref:Chalcone/stilbene synthase N-terminal domain-containing protein n=1 Tax=Escallonia rubra TaxID=112253 RepID=A0AA88R4S3_9ASTE|nr:hypothetical protein RJ640_028668 [Escallonia rubra]
MKLLTSQSDDAADVNKGRLRDREVLNTTWAMGVSLMAGLSQFWEDMVVVEIPKLGKEAAAKAIKEWGQPKSKITHLAFYTTSGVDMPDADC